MRSKLIAFYLILDLLLLFSMSFFGYLWVLNSQVSMICSMIILFASFYGYKRRVSKSAKNYELSQEELEIFENKSDKKVKFRKIDLAAGFTPFRLLSYLVLILAFFVLKRHEILEPLPFLIGLFVMPLGVFLAGVLSNGK